MRRREVILAGAGTASFSLAGCLGGDDEVAFVSVSDAIDWYEANDTVFVDARGRRDVYENLRIAGAVFSPYPDGLDEDDPTAELDLDTRIVTYCVCPHLMAEERGESLVADGYTNVHVLDEGLNEWINQGYPTEGSANEPDEPEYHDE